MNIYARLNQNSCSENTDSQPYELFQLIDVQKGRHAGLQDYIQIIIFLADKAYSDS